MAALMKFWDDPKVLAKFNEKLADVIPQAAGGAGAAAPPQVRSLTASCAFLTDCC